MNIIVNPHNSNHCYSRPDTTWEKEGRDLYIPDGVNKAMWAPVVFARVSKAGKFVSGKFVSRYYDAIGFGALVYSDEESLAFSSCMDHTSLLPMPLYNPVVFENEENAFRVQTGNKEMMFPTGKQISEAIETGICKASERISLRIGDIVAVELSPIDTLADRNEGEVEFKAEFGEKVLFDLKVIF